MGLLLAETVNGDFSPKTRLVHGPDNIFGNEVNIYEFISVGRSEGGRRIREKNSQLNVHY